MSFFTHGSQTILGIQPFLLEVQLEVLLEVYSGCSLALQIPHQSGFYNFILLGKDTIGLMSSSFHDGCTCCWKTFKEWLFFLHKRNGEILGILRVFHFFFNYFCKVKRNCLLKELYSNTFLTLYQPKESISLVKSGTSLK